MESETKKAQRPAKTRKSSKSSFAWLGRVPLLPSEDPRKYGELLDRLNAAVSPRDPIEEIWVRDLVDLTWAVFRWRRLKVNIIKACSHEGMAKVLELFKDDEVDAYYLARGWAAGVPDAVKEVDELLASAELTLAAAEAQTMLVNIDQVERIDHMIMTAEARRNNTLHEIERHREMFASSAQRALRQIEDADFSPVESSGKSEPE